jgi:hypothetical protein
MNIEFLFGQFVTWLPTGAVAAVVLVVVLFTIKNVMSGLIVAYFDAKSAVCYADT